MYIYIQLRGRGEGPEAGGGRGEHRGGRQRRPQQHAGRAKRAEDRGHDRQHRLALRGI